MSDYSFAATNPTPRHPDQRSRRGRTRLTRSLVLLALLAAAAGSLAQVASANDASVKRAFKTYDKRLTKDIAYLANFKTPGKRSSGSVLSHVRKIRADLKGAENAQKGKKASTAGGRKGRQEVLAALHDAGTAAGSARTSAIAVRGGHHSAAKHDARQEQTAINKAIPLFESGGKKLHLF
jgi:hypothetical protein